ncbi:dihydrodipicolinate synthetase [Saccharata proteae CBS 121410]|uniref:Dihydrodipicolinate synthetase n=1 Tax=Saccharata proteae CBS 121410 TaxID=1314787 RepID=A0A6A5YA14_9PEZI|nr:dihydrodipicolinate synthetase [Saccharata proteae CBS 121410]
MTKSSEVPPSGIWAPAVTFFDPDTDELLLTDQAKYYAYLSCTGLVGLIILGTNAETFLLTAAERKNLIATAREACGPCFPLMACVGAFSTKQVLLLPAAYFGKATTMAVVEAFYDQVAAESKLPMVIYNFPGICNGVDLDSDIIAKLAVRHHNIVGVKLTCGSVAKITRLAAQLPKSEFSAFGGQSDFLIGGLAFGSAGIYDLWHEGKTEEALKLHQKAALAELPCKKGIAAVKYAAAIFTANKAGIEDAERKLRPRRPYEPPSEEVKSYIRKSMKEMTEIKDSL